MEADQKVVPLRDGEFEVYDLALVPRQYLRIDERAVRSAIRRGVLQIPGVRIDRFPGDVNERENHGK